MKVDTGTVRGVTACFKTNISSNTDIFENFLEDPQENMFGEDTDTKMSLNIFCGVDTIYQ